jgi:hypothetical protein
MNLRRKKSQDTSSEEKPEETQNQKNLTNNQPAEQQPQQEAAAQAPNEQPSQPQQEPQPAQQAPQEPEKKKTEGKKKSLEVGKYEFSEGKVKFYVAKGFGKKKWILAREIPIQEIEHVESEGNLLGLTVKGADEWFHPKDKTDTFAALAEQLNAQLVEQAPLQQGSPPPQPEIQQPIQKPTPQEPPQAAQEKLTQPQQEPQPQLQPQVETQPPQKESPTQPEPQPTQQTPQKAEEKPEEKAKEKRKAKSVAVSKFEVSDGRIKLSASRGFFRKKLVVIRELPMLEIEKIEGEADNLTLTWKGNVEMFHLKGKKDSFKALTDQVNAVLEEPRKELEERQIAEANAKKAAWKADLLAVINRSIDIVDLAFNLLIALQNKHINWQEVEAYAEGFSEKMNFAGQNLPPLNLDYSKIAVAVKTHLANEASKEAFNILKAAYGYFNGLNLDDDIKENHPNFQTTKTLVYAYFLLNDLLLGKIVGDKENGGEISELEAALQSLAEANFKVDPAELKESVENMSVEADKQAQVDDSRAIFKEQLKQL